MEKTLGLTAALPSRGGTGPATSAEVETAALAIVARTVKANARLATTWVIIFSNGDER